MHTPKSISDDRPSKRLRLGTRSCVECRRRKVRCIFEPNSKLCKECVAHESECIPQQSIHQKKGSSGENPELQQKLESLEEMVYRLCDAMNVRAESSNCSPFEMSAADALTRLQASSSPETSLGTTPLMEKSWRAGSEGQSPPSDQIESFEDAPLLNLFQEAMLIQKRHVQADGQQQELSPNHRAKIYIKAIKALVPNSDDLELILVMTERFWPIWEDCLDLVIASEPHLIIGLASAKKFVLNSMKSESPMLVAKSTLFLALCVQQLPSSFNNQPTHLPAPPKSLLDSYMRGVVSLLSISESRPATVDSLECLTILAKLYLNMGKPRESWHCGRRAIASAVLLGLHNLDETASDRQKAIWAHIWQLDRGLSVLLGLPSATTDSHPGVSTPPAAQPIGKQIMHDIGVIAGHIIERNQSHKTADYSITLNIDHELQQCRNRILSEWWHGLPGASVPLTAIYGLGIIKLQFYSCQKLLHLPYMLRSSIDKSYEYSRLSALDASRKVIKSYQTVRDHPELSLAVCDVMDFQAFSAAVVIVIDLLSHSSQLETHQEGRSDWDLIHSVTRSLKYVSEAMECTVARQSAQLLQTLSAFQNGGYSGPENYEVIIPTFGKVRINRPKMQISHTEVNSSYNPGNQFQPQLMTTLEFSANSFAPLGMTGDIMSEAELGIDWTSISSFDNNYDWSQTFIASTFG